MINKITSKNLSAKKFILLPTIAKNNYEKLLKENIHVLAENFDWFVLSHIGQLKYFENIKTILIANYTFNTFNSYTIEKLKELGFSKVILSPELTEKQINSLGD